MSNEEEVIDWAKVEMWMKTRLEPDLAAGDLVRVPDYSNDVYLVDGLRAHGMLVDATPIQRWAAVLLSDQHGGAEY